MKILLYTHTDCKDVWVPFFGQTEKYMNLEKVIFVNKEDSSIPSDYKVYTYDDTLSYPERLVMCLEQLEDDIVIFQHEDMFLYDNPLYEKIEEYATIIMSKEIDFLKLLRGPEDLTDPYNNTVFNNPKLSTYGFVIQPTICKVGTLLEFFKKAGKVNIWDVERISKSLGFKCAFSYMGERKRGKYHYDSKAYPYIATAIVKGKWNYSGYKEELDVIFNDYGIDKNKRGII